MDSDEDVRMSDGEGPTLFSNSFKGKGKAVEFSFNGKESDNPENLPW